MKALVLIFLIFAGFGFCEGQRRIVGGDFAEENQFPHQVALFYGSYFLCGGSIIAKQFILMLHIVSIKESRTWKFAWVRMI